MSKKLSLKQWRLGVNVHRHGLWLEHSPLPWTKCTWVSFGLHTTPEDWSCCACFQMRKEAPMVTHSGGGARSKQISSFYHTAKFNWSLPHLPSPLIHPTIFQHKFPNALTQAGEQLKHHTKKYLMREKWTCTLISHCKSTCILVYDRTNELSCTRHRTAVTVTDKCLMPLSFLQQRGDTDLAQKHGE